MCVCVCVCVCERERERERGIQTHTHTEREREREPKQTIEYWPDQFGHCDYTGRQKPYISRRGKREKERDRWQRGKGILGQPSFTNPGFLDFSNYDRLIKPSSDCVLFSVSDP